MRGTSRSKEKWAYLYRAVDKRGSTIDFYLSPTRNAKAVGHFLGKAGCYIKAIRELREEGPCPKDLEHRRIKYLNNIIEADHGKLKQLIRPVRGFKTMETAYAAIKGFEVMRALRKGQARAFSLTRDPIGEKRMVERAFGLGPCGMTEAMNLIQKHLERSLISTR